MGHVTYLDNASTSWPKPATVFESMKNYFYNIGASPSKGGYSIGLKGEAIVDETRSLLAKLFNVKDAKNISFTHNATHSLNIAIKGVLRKRDHVIITNFEHNAVIRPIRYLEKKLEIEYTIVASDKKGNFNLSEFKAAIKTNTKLIILNHASNVLGVTSPIKEIGQIAKENGILFLVDGSQTAGILEIDVKDNNIDILAGTGHKSLMGPSGVGFLYVKEPSFMEELFQGGSGFNSALTTHPQGAPLKFEAGTLNYLGIAGLNGALKYLKQEGIANIYKKEMELLAYFLEESTKINGLVVYSANKISRMIPLCSFNMEGFASSELAGILDKKYSICVRAGLQCAPLVHKTIETLPCGTVRLSLGHFNSFNDVDKLLKALKDIC